MNRIFLYLSNTDAEVMKYCTMRARMLQELLGAMILFTGIMAFASGSYAIFTFTENIVPSVIGGLIYAFGIIQFDRFIVAASSKWATIVRIPLAVIIGFAVSMPLETYIFHKRIDELIIKENDARNAFMKDSLMITLAPLKAQIDSIAKDENVQEGIFQTESEMASKELTGNNSYAKGRNWTTRRGEGPAYRNAKENAAIADSRRRVLEHRRLALEGKFENKEDSLNILFEKIKKPPVTDLLMRIEGLEKIKANSPEANRIAWILRILLIMFEVFPAISKLLMDKTEYNTTIEARDYLNKQQAYAIANTGMRDMEENPMNFNGISEPTTSYLAKIKKSLMR